MLKVRGRRCDVVDKRVGARAEHSTGLTAFAGRRGDPSLAFTALLRPTQEALYSAGQFTDVGPVRVSRWLIAAGPRRGLTFNGALTRASVSPPRPFVGSATYARAGEQRTWSGDLGASFLGLEPTPLTGAGVRANLRHYPGDVLDRPPARIAQPAR